MRNKLYRFNYTLNSSFSMYNIIIKIFLINYSHNAIYCSIINRESGIIVFFQKLERI